MATPPALPPWNRRVIWLLNEDGGQSQTQTLPLKHRPELALLHWSIMGAAGISAVLIIVSVIWLCRIAPSRNTELTELSQAPAEAAPKTDAPLSAAAHPPAALASAPTAPSREAASGPSSIPAARDRQPSEPEAGPVTQPLPPELMWPFMMEPDLATVPNPATHTEPTKLSSPPDRIFKRLHAMSAEQINKELRRVPELDLGQRTCTAVMAMARSGRTNFTHAVFDPLFHRDDLRGLPVLMGEECQLGKEAAESLQRLSLRLRGLLEQAAVREGISVFLDAGKLRKQFSGDNQEVWQQERAVPTLVQMLQAEDEPVRLVLVEVLAKIEGLAASQALAQRALYDLAASVREAAVRALQSRPREEYRTILLEGLRYPWAPVADHAAEALVALDDQLAVPFLYSLWNAPDPAGPVPTELHPLDLKPLVKRPLTLWDHEVSLLPMVVEGRTSMGGKHLSMLREPDNHASIPFQANGTQVFVVRQLVRINHLRNCVLCHAPSQAPQDPVRGLMPVPTQSLPPAFTQPYYEGNSGSFVRADITYLRQDFSVPQPVDQPGVWPVFQRYDYLIHTRYATTDEVRSSGNRAGTYPQREAVRFALHQLTGQSP